MRKTGYYWIIKFRRKGKLYSYKLPGKEAKTEAQARKGFQRAAKIRGKGEKLVSISKVTPKKPKRARSRGFSFF